MTTIQKKTHQILSKQKQEYSQMVKDAFKGKSNLSQKQVQSTIKKVAQEYREKYGATPRKRYLLAVKEASAQKPAKPAKQAKSKIAKKPTTKKPKCKIPEYAQGEKYNEYVKHLHVITNGLLEMAKAAGRSEVKVNVLLEECYNMKGRTKHTAEDWKRLGYIPKRGEYEYLFWVDDTKRDEILFLFTDEQVKPIKEPKPDYPEGSCLVRNSNGQVVEVKFVQLVDGVYKYTLQEWMTSKSFVIYGSEQIKSTFSRINKDKAHQAWKKYMQKINHKESKKREDERKANQAQQKEDEKKRKQAYREMIKQNPEWIKKFATKVGLTVDAIKCMYRICSTDEVRPVMAGIYCDKDQIVATDAHYLVVVSVKVPSDLQGKIYAPSGKVIEGKFPKYEDLFPKQEGRSYVINRFGNRKATYYKLVKFKEGKSFVNGEKIECFDFEETRLATKRYKNLMRIFKALKQDPQCLYIDTIKTEDKGFKTDGSMHPVCWISDNIKTLLMPLMVNK